MILNTVFTHPAFWISLGLLLILSEWFLPSLVAIFFGIGALIVGVIAATGAIEQLPVQLGLFAMLSLAALFGLRKTFSRWMKGNVGAEGAGGRENPMVGVRVLVVQSFVSGRGAVLMNGVRWTAESSDALKEGDSATVQAVSGIVLTVRAMANDN